MNRNKKITIHMEIPVNILIKKLAVNRTNSFFYAGKDIAKVIYGKTDYVLTTAGEYVFTYKGLNYSMESYDALKIALSKLSGLTDTKIKKIDERGDIENWGWFGINKWVNDKIQDTPTPGFTYYGEALNGFTSFVKKDIMWRY